MIFKAQGACISPRYNLVISSQDAEVIATRLGLVGREIETARQGTVKLQSELDELNDGLARRTRRLADASCALDAYVASSDVAYRAHLSYLNIVNNLNYGQPTSSQLREREREEK